MFSKAPESKYKELNVRCDTRQMLHVQGEKGSHKGAESTKKDKSERKQLNISDYLVPVAKKF